MKHLLLPSIMILSVTACEKDEKSKSTVNTKLRSTGKVAAGLLMQAPIAAAAGGQLNLINKQLANSAVDLEYFKVPVRRINLVKGLGSVGGFSGTSPDLYACKAAENADCLVNLVDDSLDTLLSSGATSSEIETEGDTYNGVSIQACQDYTIGDKYDALVKVTPFS